MLRFHFRSLADVLELGGILIGAVVLWLMPDEPMVDLGEGLPLISGDEGGLV